MSELRTDFKDEILQEGEEHRVYNIKRKNTDEVVESDIYLEKAYTPSQEGDEFGAKEVNEINGRLNGLAPQNLLINGDFQIWQRGESFRIEGDEAFHYTADMWCVYASTGQTVKVKKTTDGLQFSNASVIMQRMNPLEVGKNYIFLCEVDGDFKTLPIVGGTYTENSFLRYNKSGSYEQFQIKSQGITNVVNARLWEGDIVYPIIEEDYATALMRCQQYIKRYIANGNVIYHYPTNKRYLIDVPLDEMAGTPTLSDIVVKWYADNGRWITGNIIEALQSNRLVTFYVSYDGLLPINQYSLTTECIFTASCEPL